MIVRLCRTGLVRLGAGAATLLGALRERGATPLVKDCLDRCTVCEKGPLVAFVDGMPIAPPTAEALLQVVDDLGADDDT